MIGARHWPCPRHLIDTTARAFLPHPRHRNRPWQSRTFAAGPNPTLASASAVNSCDVVAGGANAAGRLLADKLVVADLGTAGFKVVGETPNLAARL